MKLKHWTDMSLRCHGCVWKIFKKWNGHPAWLFCQHCELTFIYSFMSFVYFYYLFIHYPLSKVKTGRQLKQNVYTFPNLHMHTSDSNDNNCGSSLPWHTHTHNNCNDMSTTTVSSAPHRSPGARVAWCWRATWSPSSPYGASSWLPTATMWSTACGREHCWVAHLLHHPATPYPSPPSPPSPTSSPKHRKSICACFVRAESDLIPAGVWQRFSLHPRRLSSAF